MMTRNAKERLGLNSGTEESAGDEIDLEREPNREDSSVRNVENEAGEGVSIPEQGVPGVWSELQLKIRLRELELEAEDRRLRMELEIGRLALERSRVEADREARRAAFAEEITFQGTSILDRDQDSVMERKLQNWHSTLRAISPCVPENAGEFPIFFQGLENIFDNCRIPDEYRGKLVIPILGNKMRNLISRLSPAELDDYEVIKAGILEEYKLSAGEYKRQFEAAKKKASETWSQFAARMETLLKFYEKSRGVETKESLESLIVADKIKENLPNNIREYVLLQEGVGWFEPRKLGELADIHSNLPARQNYFKGTDCGTAYSKPSINYPQKGQRESGKGDMRACFTCGSRFHLARRCPENNREHRETTSNRPQKPRERGSARVNLGVAVESKNADDRALVAKVNFPMKETICKLQENCKSVTRQSLENTPKLCSLREVALECEGVHIPAIVDSGTQITVISSSFVPAKFKESGGSIKLQGAFGNVVNAELVKLSVSLIQPLGEVTEPVEIVAAITDMLTQGCLLPLDVYELLCEQAPHSFLRSRNLKIPETQEISDEYEGNPCNIINSENICLNAVMSDETRESESSSRISFAKEQQECESLKGAWEDVKSKKNGYFLLDGLLFHRDKILGEEIKQMVLPRSRRDQVLHLAHESVFGGHLGVRKVSERIRYSFYWPTMKPDIKRYVNSCQSCQLRCKRMITDRVPITPVSRPALPFQVVNLDVIGPIEPASGRGHRYILSLVCQHTRWPEAVPLRTLTAKATCEALLQIFSRTGIPEIIATDRGTNFVAELTSEFIKRLGSSPRLSTPGYPASNGLVERWNGVLKGMLHHVIREDRNWDKQLPFLLWAYREVPNCTTGVAPFQLLYGREPKGPLSILQKSWSGEIPIPCNISDSAVKYLNDLKERLERAAEQASLTAEIKQMDYVGYFNRRAKPKNFKIGDQVLIFTPDSGNKLYARWKGPAEVIGFNAPHSYKVRLEDDTVRHVHVNKIKKFEVRSQAVGVIFESEEDFGEVSNTPSQDMNQKNVLDALQGDTKLSHLTPKQKRELMKVLRRHSSLFTGKVQCALTAPHTIKLKPGVERAKPYVYRIPEALKDNVDQQIKELLDMGLIEPSQEEIAHPVVCVSKKNGEIRLCIDFRSLNCVTKDNPFPMENATDLLRKISGAKYITVLDCLKGYWSIPLDDESKAFTSFLTHRAQYRWKVMPFGLKNAASTFQRTMNQALDELKEFARAYIDDVAIFSNSWEEHLHHLEKVLTKLEKIKMSVNLSKCGFGQGSIKYLGHIIGSGQVQADPDKVETIRGIKRPNTKKELRSFLGLCNYYREFVHGFAEIAHPLTELTKGRVTNSIPWGDKEERAFNSLRDKLCLAPALHTPQLGKPYIVYTDASDIAVGACLSQQSEDGNIYPISFASHKLTDTQRAWAAIEREAFAVVWALKKFESWIFGSPIEVITDHNPLTFLRKCSPQSSKLQRWALALQKHDLKVTHCPGKELKNADGLSRLLTTAWDQ